MSTLFSNLTIVPLMRPGRADTASPQLGSWHMRLVRRLLLWSEKSRQREALRAIADDKHLLNDIALTQRQALEEAETPFWR